jgi:hypothetical protein
VIATQAEIDLVKTGGRQQMWLPTERGASNELLPCPVEVGQLVRLQPRPFAKAVPITVVRVDFSTLGVMTDAQARQQGHAGLQAAREAWDRANGLGWDSTRAWVVRFALGNHVAFFAKHRERYLKRKGVGITTDPRFAVRGEPAVTTEEEMQLARAARARRELEDRQEMQLRKERIEHEIAALRAHGFPKEVEGSLRLALRQLEKAERLLYEKAA